MSKYVSNLALNATSSDVIGGDDLIITGNPTSEKFKAIPSSKGFVSKSQDGTKQAVLSAAGIVFPEYTQTELNAIATTNPSAKYVVRNSTTGTLQQWNGTAFVDVASGGSGGATSDFISLNAAPNANWNADAAGINGSPLTDNYILYLPDAAADGQTVNLGSSQLSNKLAFIVNNNTSGNNWVTNYVQYDNTGNHSTQTEINGGYTYLFQKTESGWVLVVSFANDPLSYDALTSAISSALTSQKYVSDVVNSLFWADYRGSGGGTNQFTLQSHHYLDRIFVFNADTNPATLHLTQDSSGADVLALTTIQPGETKLLQPSDLAKFYFHGQDTPLTLTVGGGLLVDILQRYTRF